MDGGAARRSLPGQRDAKQAIKYCDFGGRVERGTAERLNSYKRLAAQYDWPTPSTMDRHMSRDFTTESLSHDPVHGYIPFTSRSGLPAGEVSEQEIIDHPWVQRLRQIHQLQTAWWVFPSAEHMRFQHVLGVMHLASAAVDHWYESLRETCPN